MMNTQSLRADISLKPRIAIAGGVPEHGGMSPMAWLQAGDWRVGATASSTANHNWQLRKQRRPERGTLNNAAHRKRQAELDNRIAMGLEEPIKPSTAYRKIHSRNGRRYQTGPMAHYGLGNEAHPAVEGHLRQVWQDNTGGLLTPRRQYAKQEWRRREEPHHSNAGHHVTVLPPDVDPAALCYPPPPPHLAERWEQRRDQQATVDARMAATNLLTKLPRWEQIQEDIQEIPEHPGASGVRQLGRPLPPRAHTHLGHYHDAGLGGLGGSGVSGVFMDTTAAQLETGASKPRLQLRHRRKPAITRIVEKKLASSLLKCPGSFSMDVTGIMQTMPLARTLPPSLTHLEAATPSPHRKDLAGTRPFRFNQGNLNKTFMEQATLARDIHRHMALPENQRTVFARDDTG